ncbi:lipopolysaccharide biosynthesis protein [Flammeovirga sp. SJP92]|uniref:lipopolysaccharide biosynthesis protein n=1 Tax=Flammeovirga sp. SJP92 TaxID=1775430 RepID=UPI000787758C|nr:oligosaccharide flippase family protein [Flammeovirga sp. SJP92]KXX68573.1 hypothetical protein AVL50_22705 [Flammeovirga sp. SJP92]
MIRNILKNKTLKKIFILIFGTGFSQLLNLAFSPILSRLYLPEHFGVASLFLSSTATLSVVGSLKFEQAILLPKENKEAKNLLHLCLIIICSITLILFVLLVPTALLLNLFSSLDSVYLFFILLLPVGFFINSFIQLLSIFLTRIKKYSLISSTRILQSSSINISQLSFSFISLSSFSLIFGQILGGLMSILFSTFFIKEYIFGFHKLKKKIIFYLMKKYQRFPKYSILSTLMNALSLSVPIFLLNFFYDESVAGYFAMSYKLLIAPVSLIGRTSKNVYFEEASKIYREGGRIIKIFQKQTLILGLIILLPLIVIFFYAKQIFTTLLGADWNGIDLYIRAIVPLIFFIMLNGPSVANINILSLQKFQFKYEVVLLVLRILSIGIGYVLFNDPIKSISFYVLVGCIMNSILILKNSIEIRKNENSYTSSRK